MIVTIDWQGLVADVEVEADDTVDIIEVRSSDSDDISHYLTQAALGEIEQKAIDVADAIAKREAHHKAYWAEIHSGAADERRKMQE